MNQITLSDIKFSLNNIQSFIHQTPVFKSSIIDNILGRKVFFKGEHLQKTGSFKIRGALNNILTKRQLKNIKGVVTHSSGNHGQAVAAAAKMLGLPAKVIVPKFTSKVKVEAIEGYGADLCFCDNSPQSRVDVCNDVAAEFDYELIHSYDDYDTIKGQGTLGLEFINQIPELDAVLISVSGGGLCSGCSIALKAIKPEIKVYCVEPQGKNLEFSLREEKRMWSGELKFLSTIADGIKTEKVGELPFPILVENVEKTVLTVNDQDIIHGMKISMKYLKQVIEASAGAAVGALFKYNDLLPSSCKNVGIILCGGNTDIDPMFPAN